MSELRKPSHTNPSADTSEGMIKKSVSAWGSKQAAEFLGVSTKTVYAWAEAGTIPATKPGRDWKFDETTLREWLQQRTRANVRPMAPVIHARFGGSARLVAGDTLDAHLDALLAEQSSALSRKEA